jgi:hypothetical protein
MENPLGLTIERQRFFDLGGRDDDFGNGRDPDDLLRAVIDAATDFIAELPPERRNDLTDIMETGVDLWEAMEALGMVKLVRENAGHAEPSRSEAHPRWTSSFIEYLMRPSVAPSHTGGRSKGKRSSGNTINSRKQPISWSMGSPDRKPESRYGRAS